MIHLTEDKLKELGFKDATNGYRATGAEIVYEKGGIQLWESSRWGEPRQWTVVGIKGRPVVKYLHELNEIWLTNKGELLANINAL